MAKKPTKYTVTDGELVLVLERDEEDPKWFVVTSPFNPDILTQARTLTPHTIAKPFEPRQVITAVQMLVAAQGVS